MTARGAGVDSGVRAERLHAVLQERFWSPQHQLFRIGEGRPVRRFGPWHHWWQSHALAALLDRHDRTGDPAAADQAELLVEGMRRRGRGLVNEFHDDMGWLALELLRMPGHDADVRTLLAAIRQGRAGQGGISWSTQQPTFHNTPATGPAALLALRLGQRTADDDLLGWGLALVAWLEETLVAPGGEVYDGQWLNPDGSTSIERAQYSYNYGLVAGAELAAHRVTGLVAHRDRAELVASSGLRRFTDPATGAWRSEGRGDGALFRAILARNLADLALATGDPSLAASVRCQADAVWQSCDGGPVGYDWPRPGRHAVDLSEHLCGLLVVEAAARLDRELGLLGPG